MKETGRLKPIKDYTIKLSKKDLLDYQEKSDSWLRRLESRGQLKIIK